MKVSSTSDRYLSHHFGPISEEQVSGLERLIGADLPMEYREFLLRENGGIPNEEVDENFKVIFGIYDGPNDLALHWRETREEMPEEILPIGENLNEDYVLLNLTDGSVHMDGQRIAPGFDHFLRRHFVLYTGISSASELIDDHKFEELADLLDSGELSIDAEAQLGKNLIQYSAWCGNEDAVEFFAERGADPSGCLHEMLESGFGHRQIIKCLLKHGANIHELNSKGQRVIDVESPWVEHIIELDADGKSD